MAAKAGFFHVVREVCMRSLVIPLSLGVGMMAIGSVFADFNVEQREEFSITKNMRAEGILEVENSNGAVTVLGVSDGNQIRITGEKIARGRNESEATASLGKIQVKVVETEQGLAVRTVVPDDIASSSSPAVTYKIEVPRSWGVRVANANGNVSINGVRKSAAATVANGAVQLNDVIGNVHVKVANGGITTTGQVPASGTCSIQTTNGAINAKLMVDPSASCDLATTNGAITLSLPASTSAGVSAKTSIGRISVQGLEFSNKTKNQSLVGGETFSGTLGSGSGTVKLAVTHGAIALKGF